MRHIETLQLARFSPRVARGLGNPAPPVDKGYLR
jgi:hypothetical protein